MESFKKLGVSENNLITLKSKGFKEPTEIQNLTIPVLMEKDCDIIAQAQTGTGKTAAFALPLIEKIKSRDLEALILAPTRELVLQVCEEINSLKGRKNINVIPIYGGQSIEIQLKKLKRNVSIVVGTPGRVLDHLKRKTLNLTNLKYFILDEADEMLNMGFIEDIETIFKYCPENKRVMLFSATMPRPIQKLAENYMGKYEFIKTKTEVYTKLTKQYYYEISESDKFEALTRIIDSNPDIYGLVFCQTKLEVDRVSKKLIERGYKASGLHGDLTQNMREETLHSFRNKKINILVATDVAARGIDILDLTHVINYSVPQNPEIYVHRIGRTGRAGKEGIAITFVTRGERGKLEFIKRITRTKINKGKLPSTTELFKIKKSKITNEILNEKSDKFFTQWAKELLEDNEPEELISLILKSAYGKHFNKRYKKINNVKSDKNEKMRLFIAKGKSSKMDKVKLIEYISSKTGTPKKCFQDIVVFDNFSFVTVPAIEGEIILKAFKNIKNQRRPIIDKAK